MKRHLVLAAWILLTFAACGRGPERLNLLLISLDTARPDHLGCYGYEGISTPHLDRMAADGVLFTDALTSAPITLPSHASVLTGLYPLSHGVRENEIYVLAGEFTTLAEILQAEGYATGAFIGSFVLDSSFGLDQGFETYDDDVTGGMPADPFDPPEIDAAEVNESAVPWLEEVEEPFFAFVHYYDPHAPYEPPPPYDSLYAGRPYDGEIAFTDRAVGEVLGVLENRGLLDRTLVVIISDHGEGLGQHDELYHGILIYDTTIKCVLIVKPPSATGSADAQANVPRVEATVELIDVMPTVLDMLEIASPVETEGRSLRPLMQGGSLPPKVCYLETMLPYLAFRWSPLRGVRFGEWKYISAPDEELYNVERDPGELRNLVSAEHTRLEDLRTALTGFIRAEGGGPQAPEAALNQEDARKLRSLGYVGTAQAEIPLEPGGIDPKRMVGPYFDLMDKATAASRRGDLEEAVEIFTTLTKMDPDNPKPRTQLGWMLVETGHLKRAEQELLRAMKVDPIEAESFAQIGSAARLKGESEKAMLFLRMAARIRPDLPGVLSDLGAVLMEEGMTDSAGAVLDRAIEVNPEDLAALVNLGLLHSREGEHGAPLDFFRRVLDLDPSNVKALVNSASIFIRLGRADSAMVYLVRAREADPANASIYLNLGNVYRQKGMAAEAAECYEAGIELEPRSTLMLFGLAAVRAQEGRREESIALLREILEIEPGFQPARTALNRLSP
jgi:arylsulfatase A-like enzyme/Flp pilus assembly protein TadD